MTILQSPYILGIMISLTMSTRPPSVASEGSSPTPYTNECINISSGEEATEISLTPTADPTLTSTDEEVREVDPSATDDSEPIVIDWQVLMAIDYEPRYFEELDMEIYSPVFSEEVKKLHGKTVIIEGFVIPFYEEDDFLSLSMNPYASCFFCGNASPASVLSLYLKKGSRRYKIDDYKKFKGTLLLNQDDPDDFYYILRDAVQVKS